MNSKHILALIEIFGFIKKEKEDEVKNNVYINLSKDNNIWNIAAISMAAEQNKPPQERTGIVCYPVIGRRNSLASKNKITTSDWNRIALKMSAKSHNK